MWLYTETIDLSAESHPFSSNLLIATRPEVEVETHGLAISSPTPFRYGTKPRTMTSKICCENKLTRLNRCCQLLLRVVNLVAVAVYRPSSSAVLDLDLEVTLLRSSSAALAASRAGSASSSAASASVFSLTISAFCISMSLPFCTAIAFFSSATNI